MNDLLDYARRLHAAYSRETSELPELWTTELPSTGCCHTAALLIQQQFGGRIIESTFDGVSHFHNDIGGIHIDATRDQFPLAGTLQILRVADPPLAVTVAKAQLLAQLAGIEAAA